MTRIRLFIALCVVCIVVGAFLGGCASGANYAAPPDYVRANMIAAEALVLSSGHGQADGYAKIAAPVVLFVDRLPADDYGSYMPTLRCHDGRCDIVGAVIKLSKQQPVTCLVTSLMHELSHDVAVRMHIVDGVPNDQLKQTLELIADQVEDRLQDDVYRPNCLKQGHLRHTFTG